MTSREPRSATASVAPFVLLAVVVLAVTGWLGWHVYDQPSNPAEAVARATEMTRISLEGANGDGTSCEALTNEAPSDQAPEWINDCHNLVVWAQREGVGSFAMHDLRTVSTDLHRSSGTVTLKATFLGPGFSMPTTVVWPMKYADGHWRIAGPATFHTS